MILLNIIHILLCFIASTFSAPLCNRYTNFCLHCNILTNLCEICEYSDVLVPDKNGGCMGTEKCINGKNNCNECDLNGKMCLICKKKLLSR